MSRFGTIARRSFLIGSAAILGGVAFGTYAYRKPHSNPLKGNALTPYVLIDAQGVTIITPRAEMGRVCTPRWPPLWPRRWIWIGIRCV